MLEWKKVHWNRIPTKKKGYVTHSACLPITKAYFKKLGIPMGEDLKFKITTEKPNKMIIELE